MQMLRAPAARLKPCDVRAPEGAARARDAGVSRRSAARETTASGTFIHALQ